MLPISGFDGDINNLVLFIGLSLALVIILLCIAILVMNKFDLFDEELLKTSKKIRTITYLPYVLAVALFGDAVYSGVASYNHEIHDARPEIVSQKYTVLENVSDGIDIYNKASKTPLKLYIENKHEKQQPEIKTVDVAAGTNSSTSDIDALKISSLSAERDAFNGIKIEEETGGYGTPWKIWNRSKTPVCITEPKHGCDKPYSAHVIKPGKYGEFVKY